MKYKHFIFDMDGTVTESRSEITQDMIDALLRIAGKGNDVVIISGAQESQMTKQLGALCYGAMLMAQNGNSCFFWENKLKPDQKRRIMWHIDVLKEKNPDLFKDLNPDDLVEDRGCQKSLSFTGHHADLKLKKEFDPNGAKREKILKKKKFHDDELIAKIGGTTCIDYISKEGTKGKNLESLIRKLRWQKNQCVYIGDALYKGGNDDSIMDMKIRWFNVDGPKETLSIIKQLQSND